MQLMICREIAALLGRPSAVQPREVDIKPFAVESSPVDLQYLERMACHRWVNRLLANYDSVNSRMLLGKFTTKFIRLPSNTPAWASAFALYARQTKHLNLGFMVGTMTVLGPKNPMASSADLVRITMLSNHC